MQNTLRFVSILYMVLLAVGLFAHVEILPGMLSVAKRDSWISVIAAAALLPFWVMILYRIVSSIRKQSLIQLIKGEGSSWVYGLLLFPLAVYMLFDAFVTAQEIIFWSQLSYMQGFSSLVIALLLLIFCLICTESGFFAMGILSSLLCPVVILLGFFISAANADKKHYELLFPVFTEGIGPAAEGFLYSSLPILELFIFIFLTPLLKKNLSKKQLYVTGAIIIGLMLGPTMAGIAEFGAHQAALYRYPAYEEWRLFSIGRYFSHADFFAIFQWLSGGVIRISLFVLIASRILAKGANRSNITRGIYVLLFAVCVYPMDQSLINTITYGYMRPISFFFLAIQISAMAVYVNKKKKKWREGRNDS